MEKISETFQVETSGRDPETGARIEPEQAPAAQVTEVVPSLQMQTATGLLPDGRPVSALGSMPVGIAVEAPVGRIAMNLRSQCGLCEYWDRDAWLAMKSRLERSFGAHGKSLLDECRGRIRSVISEIGDSDAAREQLLDPDWFDSEVERHLSAMGICNALCEIMQGVPEEAGGGLQLTFPSGGCPVGMEVPGLGTTVGDMFKPRGEESRRRGAVAYDELLMLAARGKKL